MNKVITVVALAASVIYCGAAQAGIFGRRAGRTTSGNYYYYPAQPYANYPSGTNAAYAPPAPVNGYRSNSYQPDPNVPAEFQEFNPAYGYPTQQQRNETGEPYHDAGFKIRGF